MGAYKGYQYVLFEWVLLAFTTPWVAMRLYVRYRFRWRPWREIFTITAWLLFLASAICDSLSNHWGVFNDDFDYSVNAPEVVSTMKTDWVVSITYKISIYCCKFVLLCFYMDLAPRDKFPRIWNVIMGTWALNIFGCLYQVFYQFLSCRPLSLIWTPNTAGSEGPCGQDYWFNASSWVIFLITDLLVYGIPFLILRNLDAVRSDEKRAARWMFLVGLINILCAGFMTILLTLPDKIWEQHNSASEFAYAAYYWLGPIQQATAIIVVCLPQARRVWLGTSELKVSQRGSEKEHNGPSPDTAATSGTIVVALDEAHEPMPAAAARGGSMNRNFSDASVYDRGPGVEGQAKLMSVSVND